MRRAFHLSILGAGQAPVQAGRKGKASEWGLLTGGLIRPWAVALGTSVQWSERALGKMCLRIPRFPVQVTQPPAAQLKNGDGSISTGRFRERGIK